MALPRLLHPLALRYIRAGNHPAKLRLLRWAEPVLREIECEVTPGIRLALDYGDWLQRDLLCDRGHEPLTLALLERLLHPGDIFVDVGANIGAFALRAAARVGSTGRVIAFEPNPAAQRRLRQNRALNPQLRVEVIEAAVSDHSGEVRLAQPEAGNLGGVRIDDQGEVRVRCAPLSELLPSLKLTSPVQLLKIDVEGHETAVLRGLFQDPVLRPRHIVFEFKPTFFPIADAEAQLWQPLRAAGYVVRTVDGRPPSADNPEDNLWAEWTTP